MSLVAPVEAHEFPSAGRRMALALFQHDVDAARWPFDGVTRNQIAAIDYLLKPVTEERFDLAFQRAMFRLRGASHENATRQLLAMLDAIATPPRQLERFAVRSGENTFFVPVTEVDWIEAFQNYVRLHAGPATHLLHVPMNTIETVLDSNRFLRIHRSHIVNVGCIAKLWSIAHGQYAVELKSGQRLQSGRTYSERIRRTLGNPF